MTDPRILQLTESDRQRAREIVALWMESAHAKENFETIKILFELSDALSGYARVADHPDREFIRNWLEGLKISNARPEDEKRYQDWVFMKEIFGISIDKNSV